FGQILPERILAVPKGSLSRGELAAVRIPAGSALGRRLRWSRRWQPSRGPPPGKGPTMGSRMTDSLLVNGRSYRLPTQPTVVFTIDGGDPRYLDDALARGLMPALRQALASGGGD